MFFLTEIYSAKILCWWLGCYLHKYGTASSLIFTDTWHFFDSFGTPLRLDRDSCTSSRTHKLNLLLCQQVWCIIVIIHEFLQARPKALGCGVLPFLSNKRVKKWVKHVQDISMPSVQLSAWINSSFWWPWTLISRYRKWMNKNVMGPFSKTAIMGPWCQSWHNWYAVSFPQ